MPDSQGNITFGVVGLGMGANRANAVANTEGAKLAAVCDLIEEKARAQAEKHGCDAYTSYEEMLKREDIDVIYVMTFSGLHAEHSMMAARAGKHVISTKPLDLTVAKVDELIETCRQSGVKLVTDFDSRYTGAYQTIHKAVTSGALGKIILGEARLKWYRGQDYYDINGGWHGTWALDGGGSLSNQTVHFIDQLCWMMGPVRSVYAELGVFNHDIEGEDLGTAILNFESGARGAVVGTTTAPRNLYCGIEIHGTRGAVMTTRGKDGPEWAWADGCEVDTADLAVEPIVGSAAADMVRAIREDCEPFVTGEHGRMSVAVLEALRESNAAKARVEVRA